MVFQRIAGPGLGPAHYPPGAMAAAMEAVVIAQPPDDETLRAHAAGNDAELVLARPHRALPGPQHLLPAVHFLLHVVVVAVDGDGLQLALRTLRRHRVMYPLHLPPPACHGRVRPPPRVSPGIAAQGKT